MMPALIQGGQHTVIAGLAQNNVSGLGRELIFADLVAERRPICIFFQDDQNDAAPLRQFRIWRKARGRQNSGEGRLFIADARARDLDGFVKRVEKFWNFSPSPILVRDLGSQRLDFSDPWFTFARELTEIYRAVTVTIANLGPHVLASTPIKSIPGADRRFEVTDNGGGFVTLKGEGEVLRFKPKHVPGGVVWDIKEQETSHAA
jgi:hypothetical protein